MHALGSAPFDAEGILTRENVFVDDGCLQQYALSTYAGRKLGLVSTANAGGVHNAASGEKYDKLPEMPGVVLKIGKRRFVKLGYCHM